MAHRFLKIYREFPVAVSIRVLIPIAIAASIAFCNDDVKSTSGTPGDSERPGHTAKLAKLREQSRQKVSAIKVHADISESSTAELVKHPLMTYTDEPLCIDAGTVWTWTRKENGPPLAFCKVEHYDTSRIQRQGDWLYCFASLSTNLIRADWPDGHKWTARKPGVVYSDIPDAPVEERSIAARIRQMKEFARHFSGKFSLDEKRNEELRLLPQPLYRYADPASNVIDGAVFAAVINGTNPTAFFLVELHEDRTRQVWRFGVAAMTDGGVIVEYDGKPVWKKEALHAPGMDFGTWTYFFEARKP